MGAFGFTPPACTATMGAHRPATRLKKDAIPVPVPLLGAGKTSGVYAYSTPYVISIQKLLYCGERRKREHTLEKGLNTAERKLIVGITADCEAKQENSGH